MSTGSAAAILLAAGLSSRMGSPKPLLSWQGRPLVRYQVEQLREAGCDPVIVVTGHEREHVERALGGVEATFAYNPAYREGRAGSVRAGARAVPAGVSALIVLNVDQPRSAAITRRLLEVHHAGGSLLTVPEFGGKRGHPLVLDAALLPELFEVTEESQGIRALVQRHVERRLEVPFGSDEVLLDLNTPQAYASVQRNP
jgi:molybdenum cofactor cytidylyltransferase